MATRSGNDRSVRTIKFLEAYWRLIGKYERVILPSTQTAVSATLCKLVVQRTELKLDAMKDIVLAMEEE